MADKNIQMSQRNADNTGWDNLYPKTTEENVTNLVSDLSSINSQLATKANTADVNNAIAAITNAANLIQSGWFKDKKTGLILQWDLVYIDGTQSSSKQFSLPTTFSHGFNIFSQAQGSSIVACSTKFTSNSTYTIFTSGLTFNCPFFMFAIGK